MTVYLLEDEDNILRHMIGLVQNIPYLQLLGYSSTVEKARREIITLNPELILADIALQDGNSFEVFAGNEVCSHVIFVTAHQQFAIDALNLGAFAYLLKPIDERALYTTIEKCYRRAEEYRFTKQQLELSAGYFNGKKSTGMLALRSHSHTQVIRISDIVYCHSDRGYTTFYIAGEKPLLVSKVIREYESVLTQWQFLRCHQSYLVNLGYIKRYYLEGYIEMIDGTRIPVSARKKAFVREFFEQIG